jgi:GH35 family endo-1,4-beta-xylanase
MSRAEKLILDYTMNCSNEMAFENKDGSKLYHPWLSPDDAKCAVEIAREEIYDWLLNHNDYITTNGNVTSYNMEKLVEDLKQAMLIKC